MLSLAIGLAVTWIGLTLALLLRPPVGFYITTLAFVAYLLARAGRWVTRRVRHVRVHVRPATS